MKAPYFWKVRHGRQAAPIVRAMLAPLAWGYNQVTQSKLKHKSPTKVDVPVICVGNITLGGSGKTPVVRSIAHRLREKRINAGILLRGYKGDLTGPLQVSPEHHSSKQVGDEALMLTGMHRSGFLLIARRVPKQCRNQALT